MAGPFNIEIQGLDELLDRFAGVEKGLIDYRQLGVWKQVAKVFYDIQREHFEGEGTGKSGKWAALTPKYAAIKRKAYGNAGILTASGAMRKSLTQAGATNAIYEESAQELVIGTSDPKAGYHHRGTGRMKARPIIDFTGEQERRLVEPIHKHLSQLVGNAKLRTLRGF